MSEQEKRRPGRPPLAHKPDKREIHLYIPAPLARKMDNRKGKTSMSEYILHLIKEDTKNIPGE